MAKTRKRVVFLITFIILIFFMVPFFVLVINSFKTTNEFITAPFSLPKEFNIENFKTAIQRMNFWSALRNTAKGRFNPTAIYATIIRLLENQVVTHRF